MLFGQPISTDEDDIIVDCAVIPAGNRELEEDDGDDSTFQPPLEEHGDGDDHDLEPSLLYDRIKLYLYDSSKLEEEDHEYAGLDDFKNYTDIFHLNFKEIKEVVSWLLPAEALKGRQQKLVYQDALCLWSAWMGSP